MEDNTNGIANKSGCPASRDSSFHFVPPGSVQNGTNDVDSFHILDETDENEESDNAVDYDSDIPDDEIEKMLEEALERKKRKASEAGLETEDDIPFEEKTKIVLIEKGQNHFDILPEGWIQVAHNSGMPIYLHKITRVCTLSRPYFLGPGSARKHNIPVNAIPCLSYKKALEEEKSKGPEEVRSNISDQNFPNAKIETVQENIQMQNLSPEEVREYCQKVFQFQSLKVLRFKSWSERRKFTKKRKHEKQLQRPTLPDGTKLITFPIRNSEASDSNPNSKKEWIMNPNGKSYVCILHEYVQHALKKQPSYEFIELENAATPYSATVLIKEMRYGVGYGSSKKQAKSEAAKATLEILIPEMKLKIIPDNKSGDTAKKDKDQDLSFFDEIRVEDPRVAEFCAKTTEPAPYDILLTCLQRNFGLDDLHISYQGNTSKNQGNEFTMTVGKHTATVVCKNKRDGKQRASQAILQALHPSITSWGSLLRLYGNRSVKSFKEKKMEEQEITSLQSKAAVNQPNYAILNKLHMELGKLRDSRIFIKPVGVLKTSRTGVLRRLNSSIPKKQNS
ncbi:unnamed protein product [Phaedon cochleariae]|uniref:DRBM domain-containing protein n=1 Tax=Phaedon cochleariae TaxID=80249 RepID=A0A9P0DNV9_PHACE|nr:unnamed protein product [Phaedon cochleariae]